MSRNSFCSACSPSGFSSFSSFLTSASSLSQSGRLPLRAPRGHAGHGTAHRHRGGTAAGTHCTH